VADHARTTPLLDPYDLFPKGAPSISGAVADMTFIMRRDGSLQSGIVDVGESGMDSCSDGLPHIRSTLSPWHVRVRPKSNPVAPPESSNVDRIRVVPVKACAVRLLFPASLMRSRVLALVKPAYRPLFHRKTPRDDSRSYTAGTLAAGNVGTAFRSRFVTITC
jgi:hypothetical protein